MKIYAVILILATSISFTSSSSQAAASMVGTCQFNGQTLANDSRVTAYQNSSVPAGSACVSEIRQCVDGVLYGSYAYASCTVNNNASCLFDGQTVPHGESITAYTSSTVTFGQSCTAVVEIRTCNNGVLSGSAPYSSCEANAPRSCLFNGITLDHNESITAFQNSSSQYGGTCTSETRVCNDGTLSGTYQYSVCNIDQPASCLFDGRTIAHGENVIAFSSSAVSYGGTCQQENRTCDNGSLSGSFLFSSCNVGLPASCSFDGRTISSGESVTAFSASSVSYGQACQSQARTCTNGVLSGTYTSSSCIVESPANCNINGTIVVHGASATFYRTTSVPYGQVCQSEQRTCNNGVLSGSAINESCVVENAPPAANCSLNGQIILSGQSIVTYQESSVPYGQVCASQTRVCNNGNLSGTYSNSSCTIDPAKSCTLNGKTIQSGSSITVFLKSSVPYGQTCQSEKRVCTNGVLSGSATNESCVVAPAPPPAESCAMKKIIWEFPDKCRGQCGNGTGYFKSRVSRDGGKTWSTIMKNTLPADLKEIWNYMMRKYGSNRCDRPNVQYVSATHSGYLVMRSDYLPSCETCHFVEVLTSRSSGHHQCGGHSKPKQVSKFVCEMKK